MKDQQRQITVLIAEDDEQLRDAVCDLIDGDDGFEVVAVAVDADQAVERARSVKPDVALLDMRMPAGGAPRAARAIHEASPATRCLALSAYEDRASVLEALRSGAVGYLVKGAAPREILEAISRAVRDQS